MSLTNCTLSECWSEGEFLHGEPAYSPCPCEESQICMPFKTYALCNPVYTEATCNKPGQKLYKGACLVPCKSNRDCPNSNETCLENKDLGGSFCVPVGTWAEYHPCGGAEGCPPGGECDSETGHCVMPSCKCNSDCKQYDAVQSGHQYNYVCVNNACADSVSLGPGGAPECQCINDCPTTLFHVCENNKCSTNWTLIIILIVIGIVIISAAVLGIVFFLKHKRNSQQN